MTGSDDDVGPDKQAPGEAPSEWSDEKVAQHWDRNAAVWAQAVRGGQDAVRELFQNPSFLTFVGDVTGKRVLDAGCAEGAGSRLLAERGARVVGIDISERMIELARAEEVRAPLGIRYEVASFGDLSTFEADGFDAVVATMAMMDAPDYGTAVKQFFRVLRRGGGMIFCVRHPCFVTPGIQMIRSKEPPHDRLAVADYFGDAPRVEHLSFGAAAAAEQPASFCIPRFPYTLSDYVNGLIDAGFRLDRIEEPRPPEPLCREHTWFDFWRRHAALYLFVKAVKPA